MATIKSIIIIDDHPLFREGLKTIIGRNERYQVVAEAENGRMGLKAIREHAPDLVVLDISLPDKSGIQLIREILGICANCRILIVSMHSRIDYIAEAFQAGATGYVVKESAAEGLLKGLEAVARGEYFLDRSVSHEVIENLKYFPVKMPKIKDAAFMSLTPREQEIMRLLAEGLATREIASKLFISHKTVENHRANIMKKLNIHSAMELVRYAAKLGLIDVEQWRE